MPDRKAALKPSDAKMHRCEDDPFCRLDARRHGARQGARLALSSDGLRLPGPGQASVMQRRVARAGSHSQVAAGRRTSTLKSCVQPAKVSDRWKRQVPGRLTGKATNPLWLIMLPSPV
jgi:hypothetical protein